MMNFTTRAMTTQNNDLLAAYQAFENSIFALYAVAPGGFTYAPTGSPDQEYEIQFSVDDKGIDLEFFAIGYSEEEENFYFNHSKGPQVEYQNSTNPDDLNTWLTVINAYTQAPQVPSLNSYYASELLKPFSDTQAPAEARKVKVTSSTGETKWLDLNDESASILVKFLSDHYNIKA